MPIYEYRCDNCAHEFETIQKVSEDPLKTCPACSQDALRKKISAAGFRLKGGGWYETDFKSGGKRNVAGEEKGGEKGEKADKSDKGGKDGQNGAKQTSAGGGEKSGGSSPSGDGASKSSGSSSGSGSGSAGGGAGSKGSGGGTSTSGS